MKNYSTKEKLKTYMTYAAYLIYLGIFIYVLLFIEKTHSIWFFIAVSIVAYPTTLYYERLKLMYHKSLYAMNFELQPEKSIDIFDKLQQKDILKGYMNQNKLFYVQVNLELNKADEVLKILFDNQKEFRSGRDMLLINYYYQIRAYYVLKDYEKLKETYHLISKLKDVKKIARIFSWEEIDAMYQVACNNEAKAYKTFSKVNMENMNPKERMFVLNNLIKYAKTENDVFKHKKTREALMEEIKKS